MRHLRLILAVVAVMATSACNATDITGNETDPPPPSYSGNTMGSGG